MRSSNLAVRSDGRGHRAGGDACVPGGLGRSQRETDVNVIWQVLLLIARTLVPALLDRAQDTAQDARGPGKLEEGLRARIRKDGWK